MNNFLKLHYNKSTMLSVINFVRLTVYMNKTDQVDNLCQLWKFSMFARLTRSFRKSQTLQTRLFQDYKEVKIVWIEQSLKMTVVSHFNQAVYAKMIKIIY